jgi:hypothetical protein
MNKLIFSALFLLGVIAAQAQTNKTGILQSLENNQAANQNVTTTATVKTSSRLFGTKDDLTSVILIIPSGSTVTVLDSDSTYLHVTFEENDGYIYKRQAEIDKIPVSTLQANQPQQAIQQNQPQQAQQQDQQVSRYSYLESKYGSTMAARLNAGKIWKGMDAEMVKDSWGTAEKINRVINGNVVIEEWIFKNTWLHFENNVLVEWGPVRK